MIGIGILGSGFISDAYADALQDVRNARIVATYSRSEIRAAEFARRAARQLPEADKSGRSDFVVENVGGREGLKAYVGEVYASILAESGRRDAAPPAH